MNPHCLRCHHPYASHRNDRDHKCKRQTLTKWDEKAKAFTSREDCDCAGYLGRVPVDKPGRGGCPHELLEGSRVCVICKEPVRDKVHR